MIEYDRIDVVEGIDLTKNKLVSRECWLCGYYYFLDKNFIIKDICVTVAMICQ